MIERAEVLFVTAATHQRRPAELAEKPLIDAPFKLDQGSVESLRERVLERSRQAFASHARVSALA